jgi:hypothetical protein
MQLVASVAVKRQIYCDNTCNYEITSRTHTNTHMTVYKASEATKGIISSRKNR